MEQKEEQIGIAIFPEQQIWFPESGTSAGQVEQFSPASIISLPQRSGVHASSAPEQSSSIAFPHTSIAFGRIEEFESLQSPPQVV